MSPHPADKRQDSGLFCLPVIKCVICNIYVQSSILDTFHKYSPRRVNICFQLQHRLSSKF